MAGGVQQKDLEKVREYWARPFVSEGTVTLRTLGRREVVKPIPAGESAITALTTGADGRIFGATSGRRSHFFIYDPSPLADCVVDVGTVGDERQVHNTLVAGADGCIYGATTGSWPGYPGGWLFRYRPEQDMIHADAGYHLGKLELLTVPVAGEGIIALAGEGASLVALSGSSGRLLAYSPVNGELGVISELGRSGHFSSVLCAAGDGRVCGAGAKGFFLVRLESRQLEWISEGRPVVASGNEVTCLTCDRAANVIYGGTVDGMLFRFDLERNLVETLGKPNERMKGIRALTVGKDRAVYGVVGERGGFCHLFRYGITTGELADLGILVASVDCCWHGAEFDAAATGKHGQILLGESDRISHLFIYHPPVG